MMYYHSGLCLRNILHTTAAISQDKKTCLFVTTGTYVTGEWGAKVASLVNGQQIPGEHSVTFDASNLSSGVYLYRVQSDDRVLTKKMVDKSIRG